MSFENPIPPYNASDPLATFLSFSCLDLLLTEMVPLAERMARRDERREAGILDVDGGDEGSNSGRGVVGSGAGAGAGALKAKEGDEGGGGGEVFRDAVFFRLDGVGYRVGQGLSERYVRLSTHATTLRGHGEAQ
jgi:trafficking protein particle complex subunit 6